MTNILASYLTTAEVCELLRVSPRTLQRWRLTRKITSVRLSGKILYPRTALEIFIAKRTVTA